MNSALVIWRLLYATIATHTHKRQALRPRNYRFTEEWVNKHASFYFQSYSWTAMTLLVCVCAINIANSLGFLFALTVQILRSFPASLESMTWMVLPASYRFDEVLLLVRHTCQKFSTGLSERTDFRANPELHSHYSLLLSFDFSGSTVSTAPTIRLIFLVLFSLETQWLKPQKCVKVKS